MVNQRLTCSLTFKGWRSNFPFEFQCIPDDAFRVIFYIIMWHIKALPRNEQREKPQRAIAIFC